jgi:hypothetical protein
VCAFCNFHIKNYLLNSSENLPHHPQQSAIIVKFPTLVISILVMPKAYLSVNAHMHSRLRCRCCCLTRRLLSNLSVAQNFNIIPPCFCALSMQYTCERACSVQKKQVLPTSPSSPLRDAAEHNNESLPRPLAISRWIFHRPSARASWDLRPHAASAPTQAFLKASAKRTVFLTWARSTLALLFHFISLYMYKYIECSGLWAGSHQKPRRRRSVCTGRACTKIERRVVYMPPYIFYFALSLRQIELNGAFWHTFHPLVFSSWL